MTQQNARDGIIRLLGLSRKDWPLVVCHGGREEEWLCGVPMLFCFYCYGQFGEYIQVKVSYGGSPWTPVVIRDSSRRNNWLWIYQRMLNHQHYQNTIARIPL